MNCKGCGNVLNQGSEVCPYCGVVNNFDYTNNNQNNYGQGQMMNQSNSNGQVGLSQQGMSYQDVPKNNTKILYIIIIVLLLIFLGIMLLLVFKKYNNNVEENILTSGTRTVMIYASPTNLESEVESVTTDLSTLSGKKVDLDNINILLYTGGTEYWHNFIENDENAIYILKEDGFEKLESYEQKNMSDPKTLEEFLNYAYENYKTDLYDLIVYDHGMGVEGAVVDDFNDGDVLTLKEFDKALSNSPFKDEKLEMVIFRTCLMGTAEVAMTFEPYANYLVASEEITWLGKVQSVLDFFNDVEATDSSIELGKKYIESYADFMSAGGIATEKLNCYSIIDLSKIKEIFKEINNYFDGFDLEEDFYLISRARANTYQFGTANGHNHVDSVDIKDFVSSTLEYSSYDGKKLLSLLDEAIVYNWTNTQDINGLSIYFPYNGNKNYIDLMLNHYDSFQFSTAYTDFINEFYELKSNGVSKALTAATVSKQIGEISGNEFRLQLSADQVSEFASAGYYVFRKMDFENYMPVFVSNNATLDDKGVLQSNITNKIIRIKNIKDDAGKEIKNAYLQVIDNSKNNEDNYISYGVIWDLADGNLESKSVTYTFVNKNGVPELSSIVEKTTDLPEGIILNKSDYTTYNFMTYWYKIFDGSGHFTTNWQSHSTYYGYETKIEDLELEFTSIDDSADYYCIFAIKDIYGNVTYSDAVKLDK